MIDENYTNSIYDGISKYIMEEGELLNAIVAKILLALLLTGIVVVVHDFRPAKALGGFYIRGDGSIDPSDAPIQRNVDVYTLTSDIFTVGGGIVVERDNIVIDGADHTIFGSDRNDASAKGIVLSERSNVTIRNTKLKALYQGIYLLRASNNTIRESDVEDSQYGIYLSQSSNNTMSANRITNSSNGISLVLYSGYNMILRNRLADNTYGLRLDYFSENNQVIGNNIINNQGGALFILSSNNLFFHNNIANNNGQVYVPGNFQNIWHNAYPSGGNYWSDYAGNDSYSGPGQNEPGSDGVGDVPYVIDANNQDLYPLMKPYVPIDLNGDGKIDVKDILIASKAYGSFPGHPRWNPTADINDDRKIDLRDLYLVSSNFGKTYP